MVALAPAGSGNASHCSGKKKPRKKTAYPRPLEGTLAIAIKTIKTTTNFSNNGFDSNPVIISGGRGGGLQGGSRAS
jgi:hypothetical protein